MLFLVHLDVHILHSSQFPFRPPTMSKIMDAVIGKVAPGVVMDLSSQRPKVIALLGGTAATMSINKSGSEPDITLPE